VSLFWGAVAVAALWWPGTVSGPLDGAPLDGPLEAVALGLVLPALWWFHGEFLQSRLARAAIIAIVLFKMSGALLVQEGWCVRFDTAAPIVSHSTGRIHSWDVRADWRSPDPNCSAVMTRGYPEFKKFPAWFFNLPPADANLPGPDDRPPHAKVEMSVLGFLDARSAGALDVEIGRWMEMTLIVGGRTADRTGPLTYRIELDPGLHFVQATVAATGNEWRFLPSWNQAAFGSAGFPTATIMRPGRADSRTLRTAAQWLTTVVASIFLIAWLASAVRQWADLGMFAWAAIAGAWLAYLAPRVGNGFVASDLMRWSMTALAAAVFVPVPERHKTLRGAFVLIGIPWLVFIGMASFDHVGRFSLYAAGDDMWTFQRLAYRIFLQGYWLEGGEITFWFQPGYRWVAGAWHMVFGDSSIGEFFWDGACLLAITLFAHEVTSRFAGFRWGLVAAVTVLTVIMQGPTWGFLGLGLSENAGAGFIYMAALTAISARRWPGMAAAGALASLGFFTRPNSLPMALAVAVFAVPITVSVRDALRPSRWLGAETIRMALAAIAVVAVGVFLFTLRTWYYTGVFSMFHGTTMSTHALWQPGLPWPEVAERMVSSVLMVLTMNDPARFAWYGIPLLLAGAIALAAVIGIKRMRDLPLALVLFFLAGCSSALVARGVAYSGRFSTILIGAGSAITVCAIARLVRGPDSANITAATSPGPT
jgi:hypothetical protein